MALLVAAPARATDPFHPDPRPAAGASHRDATYLVSGSGTVKFDWYRPEDAGRESRSPAIVFLNTLAERSQRDHPIYRGWAVAALQERMVAVLPDAAPDFEAGLDALLAHLVAHASEMGIDPQRIGVYAASANVSKALPVVADPKRHSIRAAAFYYGFSDSVVFRPDLPLLLVRAGLDRPPLNERLEGIMASALKANAPVTLLNLPGARHGFEGVDDDVVSREATTQTLRWMKSVLEPEYQAAIRARLPLAEAASAVLRGDGARAAALYAPLVEASPDDASLRLGFGEALLLAGRIKEARAQFDRLKGAGLGYRDLGLPASRAAMADGDHAAAIAWLASIPRRFRPPTLATAPEYQPLRERADFRALFE